MWSEEPLELDRPAHLTRLAPLPCLGPRSFVAKPGEAAKQVNGLVPGNLAVPMSGLPALRRWSCPPSVFSSYSALCNSHPNHFDLNTSKRLPPERGSVILTKAQQPGGCPELVEGDQLWVSQAIPSGTRSRGLGWRPRDIGFQVTYGLLLLRDDEIHQIPDRHHTAHDPVQNHW